MQAIIQESGGNKSLILIWNRFPFREMFLSFLYLCKADKPNQSPESVCGCMCVMLYKRVSYFLLFGFWI